MLTLFVLALIFFGIGNFFELILKRLVRGKMVNNIIIVAREEVVCLVSLIFIFAYCMRTAHTAKDKHFVRICFCAIMHSTFDLITVVTANHQDIVPSVLNKALHLALYIFAVLFTCEVFTYIFSIVYSKRSLKKVRIAAYIIVAAGAIVAPFFDLKIIKGAVTYYSEGTAVILCTCIALVFIVSSIIIMIVRRKTIPKNYMCILLPAMVFVLLETLCETVFPEMIFTSGCGLIITLGFFLALENPVDLYRQRAYMDLVTGVRNKNSYEDDQKRFVYEKYEIGVVLFDCNNLKTVNDNYGHIKGDDFIVTSAQLIAKYMQGAWRIYRIGGDEFAAIYKQPDRDVVRLEMRQLDLAAEKMDRTKEYPFGIALGYAEGLVRKTGFEEIVRRADKEMYKNKKTKKERLKYADRRNS